MGEETDARRPRRRFSERDAVEIVRTSDRSIGEVVRELGICDSSLGNWVRRDQIDRGEREGVSSDEHRTCEILAKRRETFNTVGRQRGMHCLYTAEPSGKA